MLLLILLVNDRLKKKEPFAATQLPEKAIRRPLSAASDIYIHNPNPNPNNYGVHDITAHNSTSLLAVIGNNRKEFKERFETTLEIYSLWNEMEEKAVSKRLHIIKVDCKTYAGKHLLCLFNQNNIKHSTHM